MKSMIKELWHGNIIPQEDSRNNSKEMKELLGYMARHHEDLEKTFTDEQKETFEKFLDCWSEYISLAEAAIFEYAFRLGARLTMEVQSDINDNKGLLQKLRPRSSTERGLSLYNLNTARYSANAVFISFWV